jgi:sodium pump decarboxylase gamma subunit
MVAQGITLMVAGMATVLLFLWIMVLIMHGTALFFRRFAHVFADPVPEQSHLDQLTRDDSIDIAIAVAAIRHLHR